MREEGGREGEKNWTEEEGEVGRGPFLYFTSYALLIFTGSTSSMAASLCSNLSIIFPSNPKTSSFTTIVTHRRRRRRRRRRPFLAVLLSDLIVALNELLHQNQCRIAVELFLTARSEPWHCTDLATMLGRNELSGETSRPVYDLESNGGGDLLLLLFFLLFRFPLFVLFFSYFLILFLVRK